MGKISAETLKSLAKGVESLQERASELDLPSSGEYFFYKSDAKFSGVCRAQQERIVEILQSLPGVKKKQLSGLFAEDCDEDDAETSIEDTMGDLMVRLGVFLDRHRSGMKAGGKRSLDSQMDGGSAQIAKRNKASLKSVFTHEGSEGIPRPQDSFEVLVDNSNKPFVHRWCLEGEVSAGPGSPGSAASPSCPKAQRLASHTKGLRRGKSGTDQLHPLYDALQDLQYSTWQVEESKPTAPGDLDNTPFEFVDTVEGLDALVDSLAGAREVAVDLEAHNYRSFMGFTCLMQISTREADWVVDTLELRSHIGPKLGDMFADPGVQKVLHGADSDVEWLQRDFGIYIVNMFDTGQAARVLEMPSFGLAYLLDHYCAFKADKRLQLADWRGRPLTEEMLQYARMDTHFLLYICDRLKAELLAKSTTVVPELRVTIRPASGAPDNALGTVLERSWKLCHKLYEKELVDETTYISDLTKYKGVPLNAEETAVFAALFNWRDGVARREDESPGYVMSRATMIDVARTMPTTRAKLLSVRNLSPLATSSAEKLLRIISEAKKQAIPHETSTSLKNPEPWKAQESAEECCNTVADGKAPGIADETQADQAGTAKKPVRPAVRMAPTKANGGMASALGGNSAPPPENIKQKIVPSIHRSELRSGGLGALLGSKGAAASAPASAAKQQQLQQKQQPSTALAVLMQGRLGQAGATEAKSSAAPSPVASKMLLKNLGDHKSAPSISQAKLQEIKSSFALPFSLVPPAKQNGQEGPGSAAWTAEEAEDNSAADEEGNAPLDHQGSQHEGAGTQSVSEWLEEVRREGTATGDRVADEVGAAEEERQFEEYLPMSLSETYSKKKILAHKASAQPRGRIDDAGSSRGCGSGPPERMGGKAANVIPFNYAAMSEETPGLSSAFQPQRAGSKWRDFNAQRGRGRFGRGGRAGTRAAAGNGGKRQGRERASSSAGAGQKRGIHEIDPDSLMKGGKRSSVHVRSGNRTSHF